MQPTKPLERVTLADDPRYGPMAASMDGLRRRREQLTAQIATATADVQQQRARRLPAGAELVVTADGGKLSSGDDKAAVEALNAKQAELKRTESAIALQQRQMDAERVPACVRLCQRIAPEYRKRAKRLATAARELADAIGEHNAFRNFYVGQCGIDLVGPVQMVPIAPEIFGPADGQSHLARLVGRADAALAAMEPAGEPAREPAGEPAGEPARNPAIAEPPPPAEPVEARGNRKARR